jgi:predicted dithiol-disulfide oxidoreductase (DUF899 family)
MRFSSTLPPKQKETAMKRPMIVSRDDWTAARKRLLVKEKEFNLGRRWEDVGNKLGL